MSQHPIPSWSLPSQPSLKPFLPLAKSAALSQVASLISAGPKSLDQFWRKRKRRSNSKLSESFAVIRQIQAALNLRPKSSFYAPQTFLLISSQNWMPQDEYEEMEELQKRLKSSKPSKREKAQKAIPESQTKITQNCTKLADILEVL